MPDREQQAILGYLSTHGIASSQDLQSLTGKSQATVSRLLAGLTGRVASLGKARATHYGMPRSIRGLAAEQAIFWTDEGGIATQIGMLTFLENQLIHVDSPLLRHVGHGLPWFLQPLKVQGFLGKIHASRLADSGLPGDPDLWDLESTLFSALRLSDAPGAMTLGDASFARGNPIDHAAHQLIDDHGLASALDSLASDVTHHLPTGSSAGGEQPKFLATLDDTHHVLVKFSPPRRSPFGERWHDLLHAECLALSVLAAHGVPVALPRIVESATRTYLVSRRFDRIGASGRRHVVSIGQAHDAFVAGSYGGWHATASALVRQGRLQYIDAERVAALLAFGRLIGNTDMHSGNLALFVSLDDLARGRFALAPLYDMLPMRWKPNPLSGDWDDYTPFEPDERSLQSPAVRPAAEFWERLEAHAPVSTQLRRVAGRMRERIRITSAPGSPS